LVPIRSTGSRPPFFCVHPVGGTVLCYHHLARQLSSEQPFYAIQAPGLAPGRPPLPSIERMAARYVELVRGIQPGGPYRLGGWCFGGVVAFEMAQLLKRAGQDVELLALLDTYAPVAGEMDLDVDSATWVAWFARDMAANVGRTLDLDPASIRHLDLDAQMRHTLASLRQADVLPAGIELEHLRQYLDVYIANLTARRDYHPRTYAGQITILRAVEGDFDAAYDPTLGWQTRSDRPIDIRDVPGDHFSMVMPPHVAGLAEQLGACLGRTDTRLATTCNTTLEAH
jgi:thioesterase domain-containing protein